MIGHLTSPFTNIAFSVEDSPNELLAQHTHEIRRSKKPNLFPMFFQHDSYLLKSVKLEAACQVQPLTHLIKF